MHTDTIKNHKDDDDDECVSPNPTPITKVPGPLPVAAVGGAWIWSRKLRNRIKSSKSDIE